MRYQSDLVSDPTFDQYLARLRAEADPQVPTRYGDYGGYRRTFERIAVLRDGGARIESIGRSTGGEPIFTLHLGPPPDAARRSVLYLANLHAQELIGVEAALGTIERAAARIARGELAGIAISCVPTANPDGFRRVVRDLAAGAPRFRRKNQRGVDLNRNFAEGFDARALLARLLPGIYHPGAAPLTEPETAALDGLFHRRYNRALSFHSFGGWIFWPWASRRAPTDDDRAFFQLAEAMRARQSRPYRAIQLGRWARWFAAGGAEIDHLYGKYRTLALLVEVSHGGRAIARPRTWVDPFAWFNPPDVAGEVANVADAALALAEAELT
jgi:hypothetical protein